MAATTTTESRKERTHLTVYPLHSFCNSDDPFPESEPFRNTIVDFLEEYAEMKEYYLRSMPVWCIFLVIDTNRSKLIVPLYVIEENVQESDTRLCDHCRCSGWSYNLVSKTRYHFIIPDDDEWNNPLNEDAFEAQSHLLHGLIHCNGYGHLLSIKGIEGRSKYIRGEELMELWDNICGHLRARKITVEDVSKKRSMNLRLLHGVAYGQSWFGKWEYKFCRGSFGVTDNDYSNAIETLGSISLDVIMHDPIIKPIVTYYRGMLDTKLSTLIDFLGDTKLSTLRDLLGYTKLSTLRDLLGFMLAKCTPPTPCTATQPSSSTRLTSRLKPSKKKITRLTSRFKPSKKKITRLTSRLKPFGKSREFTSVVDNSRWSTKRLVQTANKILDALMEKNGKMTRQELRDAANVHNIGDIGLLDYVLKHLDNVIVGWHVVRRKTVNEKKENEVVEYTIAAHREPSTKSERELVVVTEPVLHREPNSAKSTTRPGSDVYGDILMIYHHVILGNEAGKSTKIILDSKRFVKDWRIMDEKDETVLRFLCHISPTTEEQTTVLYRSTGPAELVSLPPSANFGELKVAATQALSYTYCVAENYQLSAIDMMGKKLDTELLSGAIESGTVTEIWVKGSGLNLNRCDLIYEGGTESTVSCACGATDDDGETMVTCDICDVRQHIRCLGIKEVPHFFSCEKCIK